jgi:hypothetical protein
MAGFVTARAADPGHMEWLRQDRSAVCCLLREFDRNTPQIENDVLCAESHGVLTVNMV